MTVAIVGGGLAGATAATELRDQGYDGPITIFAAEGHLPYERPPLSKAVLTGAKSPDSADVHDAAWYPDHGVEVLTGVAATAIDCDARQLSTTGGSYSYDSLILATGASPRRFAMADEIGTPTFYLRTMDDSIALRDALAEQPKVAIVGAGWIGLEVAAAARERDCQVTVFESASLPLVKLLGSEVAQAFVELHRSHGVDLQLDHQVVASDLEAADVIVVGIGATPNVELAQQAGLEIDNGVLVDEYLRTSRPEIFAVGDIANQLNPALGRRIRVEHWDNAIQQAKVAARNILGANEKYERLPYFFSDQYDFGMEYFGDVGPDGYDSVAIEGDIAGSFRAYWLRAEIVVAAMQANDWDSSDAVRASVGSPRD